ncbi:MAG TPA: sensor histidine kinase [Ktedonobacteraceae bacterium]|jgi:signal transduction histidine kinase
MNIYIRILFIPTVLALVLLYGHSLQQTPLTWSLLTIIVFIYLAMIWARQSWLTHAVYAVSTGLVIILISILRLSYGVNVYGGMFLTPLILLQARESRQQYRRFAGALAVITLAVQFAICYPSTLAFQVAWIAIVLYFCVRAINIYKEAYRLSQQHVKELDEAHRELQQTYTVLQEASVHSMRYAALAERIRLARDMHDGLGHQLTSFIVQLQALEIMLPGDPQRAADAVPAMLTVARQAIAEVRQAARTWSEDEHGLGLAALKGLVSQSAAHSSLALEFQQDDDLSDWSVEVSVALYRILQETLTNVLRHAEATAAVIQVRESDNQVIVTISDNGCYTADRELSPGFGLKGIIERCQALGGSCAFSQNQPHGLKIQIILPHRPPAQVHPIPSHMLASASSANLPAKQGEYYG